MTSNDSKIAVLQRENHKLAQHVLSIIDCKFATMPDVKTSVVAKRMFYKELLRALQQKVGKA